MSPERAELVAALVRELRTPLARVSLAAGELEAMALQPALAALARRIDAALRAADSGIERVLALLGARGADPEAAAVDAAEALAALRARVAPALAARGVDWRAPQAPAAPLRLDALRLRRGALCLVRAAARSLPAGGWLRVSPLSGEAGVGLELECAADAGPPTGLASLEMRASAALLGASLELAAAPDTGRARLWLAR